MYMFNVSRVMNVLVYFPISVSDFFSLDMSFLNVCSTKKEISHLGSNIFYIVLCVY